MSYAREVLPNVLKDFLIALSLANLWFFDTWKLFLITETSTYPYYHWKVNPAPLLLATIFDVLLLSAILWVAATLARRSGNQVVLNIARLIFVLVFVFLTLNIVIVALRSHSVVPLLYAVWHAPGSLLQWQGTRTIYLWLAALGSLVGLLAITLMLHSLIFRRRQLIKVAVAILLITSPFVVVTFAQAAAQWTVYRSGEQFRETTVPALSNNGNQQRRIVWIIFDEMDFRLSFFERPPTLKLPEFDRLRDESVFANNAYPPSNRTALSLPALINGRLVSGIKRTAPHEAELTFGENGQSKAWSSDSNVFSRARAMGLNTGLAGWYHPYCRILGRSLTKCSWQATSLLFLDNSEIADLICCSEHPSVSKSMLRMAEGLFFPQTTWLVIPTEDPIVWRQHSLKEFDGIHRDALTMVTDPNLNLVLVHYSTPHPPGIYNRHKSEFLLSSNSGYLDNLALADKVLAQLRQKMVGAGVWENSTVFISSDHALQADLIWKNHRIWRPSFTKEDPLVRNRTKDERVPFILRLAGESNGLIYEPAFNTVLSHDLILAILSGEISKKEQVITWLDHRRSISESPYMSDEK